MKIRATVLTIMVTALAANAGDVTTDNLTVMENGTFYGAVEIKTISGASPTNGLKLYYDFWDSTSPVPDQSGNGNTGVVTEATWTSAGRTNGAYVFDGVNDYITSTTNVYPGINYTSCFTMAFWMNTDPACGVDKMPFQLDAPNNYNFTAAFYANLGSTGMLWFGAGKQGYAWSGITANVVQTGIWQYVVGTYSNLAMCLYVDGVLVASGTSTITDSTASMPNIVVGAQRYVALFKGKVDEPRFYNRALSSEEVMRLYAYYAPESFTNTASLYAESITTSNSIVQTSAATPNTFMGMVGIGTNSPATNVMLHVNGDTRTEGNLAVGGTLTGNGSGITNIGWAATASAAASGSVLETNMTLGVTAYGWGDHSTNGYLTVTNVVPAGDIPMGDFQ